MTKNNILYTEFPNGKINDTPDLAPIVSQYAELYPKMTQFLIDRSGNNAWSKWHEMNERWARQEIRKFGQHEVYKFIHQSYETMVFSALAMSKFWQAMEANHAHVGFTWNEFEDELDGEADYKRNKKDSQTIKKAINYAVIDKIIGTAKSRQDKRVSKYFPTHNMIEFYAMKSRAKFLFYIKNGSREIIEGINKRLILDDESGSFKRGDEWVWNAVLKY